MYLHTSYWFHLLFYNVLLLFRILRYIEDKSYLLFINALQHMYICRTPSPTACFYDVTYVRRIWEGIKDLWQIHICSHQIYAWTFIGVYLAVKIFSHCYHVRIYLFIYIIGVLENDLSLSSTKWTIIYLLVLYIQHIVKCWRFVGYLQLIAIVYTSLSTI